MEDSKFQFRLEAILVSNFSIIPHPEVHPDSGLASIEFGYSFTFDPKIDIAICKAHFKYSLAADLKDPTKGHTPVMNIDIQYVFKVLELHKYVKDVDGKQHLETGVLLNLVSVAYSTSRGIIYERTRGYGINNLPLSVLNIQDYIKDIKTNMEMVTTEVASSTQPS